MKWDKAATNILGEIDGLDVGVHDLDNIAYYMTHLSSPTMWRRMLDLGGSMVYHSGYAISTHSNKHEGEQLWLPFEV